MFVIKFMGEGTNVATNAFYVPYAEVEFPKSGESGWNKLQQFWQQFGSEGEFVAWCEGNGVKGIKKNAGMCLVSKAVYVATGQDIAVEYGRYYHIQSVNVQTSQGIQAAEVYGFQSNLPEALKDVPYKFDSGHYPQLEVDVEGWPQPLEES